MDSRTAREARIDRLRKESASLSMSQLSPLQRAHVFMLMATTFYGLNFGLAKLVMPQPVPPFGFIFMRGVGATLCFFIVSCFIPNTKAIEKKDAWRIIACGLFGACTNMLLFFKGLAITSPVNASLMVLSTPLVVALISYLSGIERFRWTHIAGLIIGLAGALCFILPQNQSFQGLSNPFGDMLVFLNAVSYGLYLIIAKPLLIKYNPITVIKWAFLCGSIAALPFTLKPFLSIEYPSLQLSQMGAIAFVVIGATFMSYLFNIQAMKYVKPSLVGYYTYLQPLVATLFALFVFGERLGWLRLVAAFAIFLGIYLISTNKTPAAKPKS